MSEPLRLAPFDLFIDPLLAFQDARLRELLAYWEGKRAGRPFPARSDVSPADIVSHLPSVFLVDAVPPALGVADFRVRLMGTALNDLFARKSEPRRNIAGSSHMCMPICRRRPFRRCC